MNRIKKWIPYLWLAGIVLGMTIYMHHYFILDADDDTGAEMILSYMLSDSHGILSKDWVYSTEIRVLNMQLIYSFLFHFLDDWQYVRTIGNAVMYMILVLSVGYLCSQLGIKKYFALVAALFMIPVSRDYYFSALQGAYLLPHITISVLLLALFFDFCKSKGKRRNIAGAMALLTALLSGMGGIRQLIIFGVPLVLACLWMLYLDRSSISEGKWFQNTHVQRVLYSIALLSFMLIGLFFNKIVLSKYYSFGISINDSFRYDGSDIWYSEFNLERVGTLITGWLSSIGYHYGGRVFSETTVINVLPAVIIVLLFMYYKEILQGGGQKAGHSSNNDTYDDCQKITALFLASGVLILNILYFFTDMQYRNRYLMPVSVFSFVVAAIYINNKVNNKKIITWSYLLGILYLTGYTVINLYNYTKMDAAWETRIVADILTEEGYYEGYSSACWLFGNSITEYTDGKVRVWRMIDIKPELMQENESGFSEESFFYWLCDKNMLTEAPSGKIFCILYSELEEMDKAEILYQSDSVIVYGYDSYDAFVRDMNDQ